NGFAAAKRFAEGYATLIEKLSAEEKTIRDWRFEPMHDRDMLAWGPVKLTEYNLQWSLRLTRRSISSSARYRILERDHFTCRICGRNAADNVRLEVDHKTSVRDGGNNHEDNLWTLCFECNRGKGAASLVD
ncbi:MAG: HNH endonuclease, partial [Cypionkella sp.]